MMIFFFFAVISITEMNFRGLVTVVVKVVDDGDGEDFGLSVIKSGKYDLVLFGSIFLF